MPPASPPRSAPHSRSRWIAAARRGYSPSSASAIAIVSPSSSVRPCATSPCASVSARRPSRAAASGAAASTRASACATVGPIGSGRHATAASAGAQPRDSVRAGRAPSPGPNRARRRGIGVRACRRRRAPRRTRPTRRRLSPAARRPRCRSAARQRGLNRAIASRWRPAAWSITPRLYCAGKYAASSRDRRLELDAARRLVAPSC